MAKFIKGNKNLRNNKKIMYNGKEIKEIEINNYKIIKQQGYNIFEFTFEEASSVIINLANGGAPIKQYDSEYDTDWGDGNINKEISHTYNVNPGDKFVLKTKYSIYSPALDGKFKIRCLNIDHNMKNANNFF